MHLIRCYECPLQNNLHQTKYCYCYFSFAQNYLKLRYELLWTFCTLWCDGRCTEKKISFGQHYIGTGISHKAPSCGDKKHYTRLAYIRGCGEVHRRTVTELVVHAGMCCSVLRSLSLRFSALLRPKLSSAPARLVMTTNLMWRPLQSL